MEEEDRYTRITLRIPKDLHAKLQAESDRTSKSMNAGIIARLEQSFIAETEFQIGSTRNVSLAPDPGLIEQAIEAASDRSAAKTALSVLESILVLDEAHPTDGSGAFLEAAIRSLKGLDKDGQPIDYNPPRTPKIPGVNTPKRGSKRTDLPKK